MKNKIVKELPKVDVLIISYNQENVIEEAIQSALNQTYQDTHIVVADDCSTDKTRSIIEKLESQFPNKITKVFNKKNLGITGNSNAGLKECYGDYFVIMGGDDVLYPNKIEEQINWFNENPDYALNGHSLDLINEHSKKIGKYNTKLIYSEGLGAKNWITQGILFGCMSIMIKKDKSFNVKFDERLKYSSDLKFFIDFLGNEKKYGYLKKTLGDYRKSETSITHSKFDECMNDAKKMFDILKNNKSFTKWVKQGENYMLNYGVGLKYIKTDKTKSRKLFFKTIKINPFFVKAYIRLMQSFLF